MPRMRAKQRPARQARPKADSKLGYQFLVTLSESERLVWRRIQVPAAYSFWDLHVAIQNAMGWQDRHLHEFRVMHPERQGLDRIGIVLDDISVDEELLASWETMIAEYFDDAMLPAEYRYDFGDGWSHTVTFEQMVRAGRGQAYPRCVAGARACPPEDCGGMRGYAEFLEALSNARHPRHKELLRWHGGPFDPEAFDPSAIVFDDPKKRLAQAFG